MIFSDLYKLLLIIHRDAFQAILTRCGLHLKQLDMSGVVHLLDDQAFEIVSSLCPNLEKVLFKFFPSKAFEISICSSVPVW